MMDRIIERANDLWSAGSEAEAIDILAPLAENGDLRAKAALGLILCHRFEGGRFPELEIGSKMLMEACEAGEPSSCHNLGALWLGGTPAIGHDLKKAAYYYLKAKELGAILADDAFYSRWERILNG